MGKALDELIQKILSAKNDCDIKVVKISSSPVGVQGLAQTRWDIDVSLSHGLDVFYREAPGPNWLKTRETIMVPYRLNDAFFICMVYSEKKAENTIQLIKDRLTENNIEIIKSVI